MRKTLGLAVGFAMTGGAANACTICHSLTALGVRHLLFEHDLLRNAAAIAAPLPILMAVILFAAREPMRAKGTPP